jgi:hypothetical protein
VGHHLQRAILRALPTVVLQQELEMGFALVLTLELLPLVVLHLTFLQTLS